MKKKPTRDGWKIVDLAAAYGISTTTARDILKRAGVEIEEGGVNQTKASAAFISHYRSIAEGPETEAAQDRARKAKAEADAAELDTAHKLGALCLKADVEMMWKDAIQQGVENISNLRTLTKKQKEAVFKALRQIKLKENGD